MKPSNGGTIQAMRYGPGACVTLSDPVTLNALSPRMVSALFDQLTLWRDDPCVKWVVIEGAGERAFSAGADIKAMWRHAVAGEHKAIEQYFAQEYEIDLLLAEYPKACIALVDGICFGGGMGLAVNAGFSVASEAALFSMPETSIGFFPDAGATWFLSKLPRALCLYLGLTGATLTGADAVRLGLIDYFVPNKEFSRISAEIISRGTERLSTLDYPLPLFSLRAFEAQIHTCFDAENLEEIFARLDADTSAWAAQTKSTLGGRSPSSLRWAFDSLSSPGKTLRECLQNELALVAISARHADFREGIRAVLIDKDKAPRWASLSPIA